MLLPFKLFIKLQNFGKHSALLSWLKSYLTSCSQYFKILGRSSRWSVEYHKAATLASSVRSIIYHSKYQLFADDLNLHFLINNSVTDVIHLQANINLLNKRSNTNRLCPHIKKYSAMSFYEKMWTILFDYNIEKISLDRVTAKSQIFISMLNWSSLLISNMWYQKLTSCNEDLLWVCWSINFKVFILCLHALESPLVFWLLFVKKPKNKERQIGFVNDVNIIGKISCIK